MSTSIADELAELRSKGITSKKSATLKDVKGLSTPEQEQKSLKNKIEREKTNNYKKDAEATLRAGSGGVNFDQDFKAPSNKKSELAEKKGDFNEARAKFSGGKTENNVKPVKEKDVSVVEEKKPSDAVVVEDVNDDDDDDDVPNLEEQVPAPAVETAAVPAPLMSKQAPNRAEKKSRKAVQRLGMKPVSGIARMTLKTSGRGYYAIDNPDVYISTGANPTYVVFGEAKQGGNMQQELMQQASAARQFSEPKEQGAEITLPKVTEEEIEEIVDETGLESKDIELVISQASCSRGKAVKALRENDGDLVNAIMSLTT